MMTTSNTHTQTSHQLNAVDWLKPGWYAPTVDFDGVHTVWRHVSSRLTPDCRYLHNKSEAMRLSHTFDLVNHVDVGVSTLAIGDIITSHNGETCHAFDDSGAEVQISAPPGSEGVILHREILDFDGVSYVSYAVGFGEVWVYIDERELLVSSDYSFRKAETKRLVFSVTDVSMLEHAKKLFKMGLPDDAVSLLQAMKPCLSEVVAASILDGTMTPHEVTGGELHFDCPSTLLI